MSSPLQPAGADPAPITRVIMVLDVVESVRLMEHDEHGYIRRWQRFVREAHEDVLPAYGGRILKSTGDGLMLEFAHAADAVAAGFELLRVIGQANEAAAPQERMQLRVTAHVARFVADEYDIYGCGVNIAVRLQGVARPGEICISAELRELLEEHAAARVEDAGTHSLRHVRDPVRVFRLHPAHAGQWHEQPDPGVAA